MTHAKKVLSKLSKNIEILQMIKNKNVKMKMTNRFLKPIKVHVYKELILS